jgi:processive 1,2-diacylglycerol beta-glucosyltransferase
VCKGARKLKAKVEAGGFDTVICTHPFSATTLTRAIKKYGLKLDKTYFVSTDYTCSPGVSGVDMDYYIIPHESLAEDFIEKGIEKEKLFAGGIPVSNRVNSHLSKKESKRELSIGENKRVILLMCGSMGCGPMKLIASKLSKCLKDDEYLVVICGSNHKLFQKLRVLEDPASVRVLGFTRNVPLYMNSAELLLTKPGGLSTTEAAHNHLPMILIDAVAGCETHNMNFWVNNKMAQTREDTTQLCELVRSLMDNEEELGAMRKKLEEAFSLSSAEKLVNFVKENHR